MFKMKISCSYINSLVPKSNSYSKWTKLLKIAKVYIYIDWLQKKQKLETRAISSYPLISLYPTPRIDPILPMSLRPSLYSFKLLLNMEHIYRLNCHALESRIILLWALYFQSFILLISWLVFPTLSWNSQLKVGFSNFSLGYFNLNHTLIWLVLN